MQNLYYYRAKSGRRLLFAACEIKTIKVYPDGSVVIYTPGGCPYPVVSRHPERVIKEPPRRTDPDAGYQFDRYAP